MVFGQLFIASFLVCLFVAYKLYRYRRSDIGKALMVIGLLTSFWLMMEGLSFYVQSSLVIVIFQKLKYIAIILIPPLLIMVSFLFMWSVTKANIRYLVVLFVIPLMSLISLSTNILPYSFISDARAYFENGIPMFEYQRNLGFFIHIGYSYLLSISNSVLLLYRALKMPKFYRFQSLFVFWGALITVIMNIAFVFGAVEGLLIDTTPISILLTLIVYYIGIYTLPINMIVPRARNLVIENMSDMVVIVDNKNKIIDVNPAAKQVIVEGSTLFNSKEQKEFSMGTISFQEIVNSMDVDQDLINLDQTVKNYVIKVGVQSQTYYFKTNVENIIDTDNSLIGRLYIFVDITEIQSNVNRLLGLNEELRISESIINDALEGVVITDKDNKIIRVNQSLVDMTGYTVEELINQKPNLFKSDRHDYGFYRDMWDAIITDGFWEGEIWDRKKNGDVYPKWMSIKAIVGEEDQISHFVGISSDITKMKKAEDEMRLMAYYDALTGLPNRILFKDRLETAVKRSERHDDKVALLYMDLDRFKTVNDSFGHDVGDELLIAVAKRVNNRIRKTDTFCRLGGDEFTLIIEDLSSAKEAAVVAQNILDMMDEKFIIRGHEITTTFSIGIAIAPDDDQNIDELIRKADIAMYASKENASGSYVYSSKDLERSNRELNRLDLRLKEAIKNQEFELYLQPQISIEGGITRIFGAEALIRWPQKDESIILPGEFISVAEKNGTIQQIGLWVLEEVFRINNVLQSAKIDLALSFNASIKQFDTPEFIDLMESLLEYNSSIDLSMEITESLLFNDLDKGIRALDRIKDLGVSIALDDFGTGYSSMSYLNRLPIDYLKIDKSFIDTITEDNPKNLAYMILSMAKTLNLKTIAEGIEDYAQVECLMNAKCDVIQGYYYAKPLPLEAFISYVSEFESKSVELNQTARIEQLVE